MLWYWVFLTVFVFGAAAAHSSGLLRFHDAHPRVVWVIAAFIVFNASWMGFDGARAFVVGDLRHLWRLLFRRRTWLPDEGIVGMVGNGDRRGSRPVVPTLRHSPRVDLACSAVLAAGS
jgi:hypothetical protein